MKTTLDIKAMIFLNSHDYNLFYLFKYSDKLLL